MIKCDLNFAQNVLSNEDLISNSFSKRERDAEDLKDNYKKPKVNDSNLKPDSKSTLGQSNDPNAIKDAGANKRTVNNRSKTGTNLKQRELETKNSFNCKYCKEQYLSNSCLFYMKREPQFKENDRVCDCCSSEEEEGGPENLDEKPSDLQKVAVNPGWYGKGLRKNNRKKR